MTCDPALTLKPPGQERPIPAARKRWRRVPPAAVMLLPIAVVLWIVSLGRVDLGRMGDYGLINALPLTYWLALAVLTAGFTLVLLRPRIHGAWICGHVVALVGMLYATPTLLYGTLRYSWAWKHVAVVDYLLQHNGTDTTNGDLGVYHQWPGFFTFNALLVRAAGLPSAMSYAAWGPLVNNLLLIGPLVLLYRSMTSDRRLVWTGVWVFFSCSWVGQDYFSPQAFAFFLYLTVIALLLNRLYRPGLAATADAAAKPATAGAPAATPPDRIRAAGTWFAVLFLLVVAIASSHQLTPVILVSALGILAISRRRWRALLPLLLASAAFTVLWCATVARPFIAANLHSILKSFGKLDSNVGSTVAVQANANAQQQLISRVELLIAVGIGVLALIAVVKWRDLRRSPALLLALAPVPLMIANDYGGEIIFRAYLFALPGTAFLGASVLQRFTWRPRLRAAVSLVVFPVLLIGFALAYYGKERENYFSPDEVAASRFMYATAPHGSMIIGATSEYPGAFTEYEYYRRESWLGGLTVQERADIERDPAAALAALMRDTKGRPAYFILTKSQEAEVEQSGLLPGATLARVEAMPGTAPEFRVIYRNADAAVLVLANPPVTSPALEVPAQTPPSASTPAPASRPAPAPTSRPTPPPTSRQAPAPTSRPAPVPGLRPTPLPTSRLAPAPASRSAPAPLSQPAPAPAPARGASSAPAPTSAATSTRATTPSPATTPSRASATTPTPTQGR